MPSALLITRVAIDPDRLDSAGIVQSDAAGIGQRGPGIRAEIALGRKDSKERFIQSTSDTAPLEVRMDVDGCLHDPLISRTRFVPLRISVAGDASEMFAHQPRIGRQRFADAPGHFLL